MKCRMAMVLAVALLFPTSLFAQFESFSIKPVSKQDYYKFIKVFSEMRGPIRSEILKDKNTNFKDADPLKYVSGVKDNEDVLKVLKESDLSWQNFSEIMANILLGYFNIQPEQTKVGLIRQLSSYGLTLGGDQIPPEYQEMIKSVLATDQGAGLAGLALDQIVQIPPENIKLAKENKRQLDQLFYTRFWKGKL